MRGIIYLITNTVNGKQYVGQTTENLRRRWGRHITTAIRGAEWKLSRAIRKHGNQVFSVVTVCKLPKETLNEVEQFLISELNTINDGYNMVPGGYGCGSGSDHPLYGKSVSTERREKISKALTGKPLSHERKENMRRAALGRTKSAAHIANVAIAHRGTKRPGASSKYSGVSFDKSIRGCKKWLARVREQGGKVLYKKRFSNEEEAAKAVDAAITRLNLSYPLNFPLEVN
jgi:group I intron endonuclease